MGGCDEAAFIHDQTSDKFSGVWKMELRGMKVPRVTDLRMALWVEQKLEGERFVVSGGPALSQSCVHITYRKIKHCMTPNLDHRSMVWGS